MDISFATWMAYNIPPMCMDLGLVFFYLVVIYLGVPDWLYFWRKTKAGLSEEEKEVLNR